MDKYNEIAKKICLEFRISPYAYQDGVAAILREAFPEPSKPKVPMAMFKDEQKKIAARYGFEVED